LVRYLAYAVISVSEISGLTNQLLCSNVAT
jgi:hypothetical protein